ncbi:MAG: ABC transporter ATP-binding protein [Prevotella sp.]|nr:ABC transporter ATP-binding protein [Prevotella sp.]
MSFQPGRIYGILGPNGTGKTTLLYICMGLLQVRKGMVEIDGRNIAKREHANLKELFIVPEEFELPEMTLHEYVETFRPFYPHFSDDILQRCLDEFQLPNDLHINRLSMGQKKKVLMAFALACGTKYLLMDEPTNGLDIQAKKQFRKVIATNMNDDKTIIISTHQVHDVEQLLDHVIIIGNHKPSDSSSVLCDSALPNLTKQYSFTYEPQSPTPSSSYLYSERTAQGYATISIRQQDEEETPINLELLYNAVQNGTIQITNKTIES